MPVSIDPDQQKNEETTKLRHITPVISERWQDVDKVLMEYYFTDGRISVDEYNMAHRGKPKKAVDMVAALYNGRKIEAAQA